MRQYGGGRLHRPRRGIRAGEQSFVAVCGRLCWGTDADTEDWLDRLRVDGQRVMTQLHRVVPECQDCMEAAK